MKISKQRIYSFLLGLGACVLIYRCLALLFSRTAHLLIWWVIVLLFLELVVDVACLVTSAIWWRRNSYKASSVPLQFGAAATIIHAVRVLVFILGRTQILYNFDVKPEFFTQHAGTWNWFHVYFAGVMSVLGLIVMTIIWQIRRNSKRI